MRFYKRVKICFRNISENLKDRILRYEIRGIEGRLSDEEGKEARNTVLIGSLSQVLSKRKEEYEQRTGRKYNSKG